MGSLYVLNNDVGLRVLHGCVGFKPKEQEEGKKDFAHRSVLWLIRLPSSIGAFVRCLRERQT